MTCSIVTVDRQLTAVVKANVPFPEIPLAQRSARAAIDAATKQLYASAKLFTLAYEANANAVDDGSISAAAAAGR